MSNQDDQEGLLRAPDAAAGAGTGGAYAPPTTAAGTDMTNPSPVPGTGGTVDSLQVGDDYPEAGQFGQLTNLESSSQTGSSRVDFSQIQQGWDVYGSDGDKIGDVDSVGPNYLTVKKGWLFTHDIYVPFSAITSVDNDRVYLNVTKDQVGDLGWDQPPTEDAYAQSPYSTTTTQVGQDATTADLTVASTDTTAPMTGYQGNDYTYGSDQNATVEPVVEEVDVVDTTPATSVDRGTATTDRSSQGTGSDTQTVRRYEEQLNVEKTPVQQVGAVEVNKDVVYQQQSVDVPVTREAVTVTTRDVNQPVDNAADAFQEQTVEVPVSAEQVTANKETVLAEEIELQKQQVQDTQRVSDTVRKEVVNIDTQGDVDVEGTTGTRLNSTDVTQ